jgi:peptidoglycan/LPS O-acetylase OafA/YrhL
VWTALVLLPVWLSGCRLAETVGSVKPSGSRTTIWGWRAAVWGVMWVTEALNFHSPISQVYTMMLAGLFFAVWISRELAYGMRFEPPSWLQNAGNWSYSLYLVHPIVFAVYEYLLPESVSNRTYLGWTQQLVFAVGLSYLFYLGIERPAHLLAKKISLRRRSSISGIAIRNNAG